MNKYSEFSQETKATEDVFDENELLYDEELEDEIEEEEEYTGPQILTDSEIISIRKEDGNCYYITTSTNERFRTGENIIVNLSNKEFKNKEMYCIYGGGTEWYFSIG